LPRHGGRVATGDSDGALRYAAGFIVVFVGAVLPADFCGWPQLVDAIGLRPADRTLGAVFGVVRGVVLLLVVAVVVGLTPLHEAAWWQESHSAPVLGTQEPQACIAKNLRHCLVTGWPRRAKIAAGCYRKWMESN
jgi:hypothetical protein